MAPLMLVTYQGLIMASKKDATISQVAGLFLLDPHDLLLELLKIGINKTHTSDTINLDERKKLMQHLSDNGNAAAQLYWGHFYYNDKNYKEAFNLWHAASLQEGMLTEVLRETVNHNIGLAYYSGKGVPREYNKAAEWFIKSAEIGGGKSQHSQYNLAIMYINGEGVERDISEASYWANKARTGNNQDISNLAEQLCNKHKL